MSKYIDAEKLVAEIERRKGFYERTYERLHRDDLESSTSYAIASALDKLLSFITSLQQEQPEVDLEEEIDKYYHDNLEFIIGPSDTKIIVSEIARNFYELGLKAGKEE